MHNEELRNLYSSRNIFRMLKSRTIRWTGYVAYMERKCVTMFWRANLNERGTRQP
jgi:hypothetical protein